MEPDACITNGGQLPFSLRNSQHDILIYIYIYISKKK
jgi:hypothetical protein